jgi:uncharacterized Tic20 family protein
MAVLVFIPIFIVPFIVVIHILASLVAILQALQGNFFKYPLIVRFIPSP